MPTFHIYQDASKVGELIGANKKELKELCDKAAKLAEEWKKESALRN